MASNKVIVPGAWKSPAAPPAGFYDMAEDRYHGDPCDTPSLSSSIAKALILQSPAHARLMSKRLCPPEAPEESTNAQDFGKAAHKLILGKGADIEVLAFDSYRKKEAQELRDAARAAGKIPLLEEAHDRALHIGFVGKQALGKVFGTVEHLPEVVGLWQAPGGGWRRMMIDALSPDGLVALDVKTTAKSANPLTAARMFYDHGFHWQEAHYTAGLDALHKAGVGSRRYFFMVIESKEPHAVVIMEGDPAGREMALRDITKAGEKWDACIAANAFPTYAIGPHVAVMPAWSATQALERQYAEEEE